MSIFEDMDAAQQKEVCFPLPKGGSLRAVAVKGSYPGKTLVITAGVHGNEYVGIQAVKELLQELSLRTLCGRLLVLPLINEKGFYRGMKQVMCEDGRNLNRVFPGSEEGSYAQQIAYVIEKRVYPQADFLVDLHGGDVNETMTPLLFYSELADERTRSISMAAAGCLSVELAVSSKADNGLYSYASLCAVPSLLIERGGRGIWSREEVAACKQNLYELMGFLAMLPYPPTSSAPVFLEQAWYEEAQTSGFWYCSVQAGEHVGAGQLLGVLMDWADTPLQKVYAKEDGVVMYLTHALGAERGTPLIAYGRPRKKV